MLVTYATAHGNAISLTHRVRTEIEPGSSWILVRFVTTKPQQELPRLSIFLAYSCQACLELLEDNNASYQILHKIVPLFS